MTREYMRAVLRLSCDDRLVAGVGGAVAHFADRVGLEDDARTSLVAALEDLCRKTLPLLDGRNDVLNIAIADFEDRIEIVVEHRGQMHSAGVGAFVGLDAREPVQDRPVTTRLMQTVDRVECHTQNGSVRTTLVKYIGSRNGNS